MILGWASGGPVVCGAGELLVSLWASLQLHVQCDVLTGYSGKWAKAINQGLFVPREMVVKYPSLDHWVGPYEIAVFTDFKKKPEYWQILMVYLSGVTYYGWKVFSSCESIKLLLCFTLCVFSKLHSLPIWQLLLDWFNM